MIKSWCMPTQHTALRAAGLLEALGSDTRTTSQRKLTADGSAWHAAHMQQPSLQRGIGFALSAAVLFGVTTPAIARASLGVGPFATAACLYGGAALAAASLRLFAARHGRAVGSAELPRLLLVALFGALLAPGLLVWGIGKAGPTPAALALNLEAVATVLLARAVFGEPIGPRVLAALSSMLVGGTLLAVDVAQRSAPQLLGVLAVVAATLAWAIDNTLTRAVAENDPLEVVAVKGALGGFASACVAQFRGEAWPNLPQLAALALAGAFGFGLSLRLYLLAQRQMGAARTASVFAVGPFIGAAVAWLLGDRNAGTLTALGALAFAFGVWLHVHERHRHGHVHAPLEHEHAHRHDDGHHLHEHDPPVVGEHTHVHRHSALEHDHEHAPDIHHDHSH
jgi:drug/metabolite transporter (DMT)-like permease